MTALLFLIGLSASVSVASLIMACLSYFSRRAHGPASISGDLKPLREDSERQSSALRQEVLGTVTGLSNTLDQRFQSLSSIIEERMKHFGVSIKDSSERLSLSQGAKLGETNTAVTQLADKLEKQQIQGRKELATALEKMRETIGANFTDLRKENEKKLEQMRLTVDEKLQGTLEKRLGESFKLVSDRLENVHQGLGEMQKLAIGVGDLKRVLTNVKSRGGWAEVQLGSLLEDMLTPEQYGKNVAIPNGSSNLVEYVVKLPGHDAGEHCLVPIDAKFPIADYERLLAAQESGALNEVELAGQALERCVRAEAQRIQKYVCPPETTNFAIMYLPTEGLFAEVIRRPGFATELQNKYRVNVTGPTTLSAVLSSLQMGFTTLTIQKRSSEVWQVLGAVKQEFAKYGDVWDKLARQLDTAQKTVEEAGRRTKAVGRRLRGVETPIGLPLVVSIEGGTPIVGLIDDAEFSGTGAEEPALTAVERAPTSAG